MNASSVRNGSSINRSEHADKTPPTNLVRQTSTPMTKMLHEMKRHNYDSMSASSIQMSSIENCSSETDISPPIQPNVSSNFHVLKPPNRRMPVAATPYRQIMSKSIQRAFNSQGISRVRSAVSATPPLDLRTSPVIRRTISMEGNGKPRPVGARNDVQHMVDLRTTPVIRRHIEAKNLAKAINARPDILCGTFGESERNKSDERDEIGAPKELLQRSSLSRSKSTNTFFETCQSFDLSVASSDPVPETPKPSTLSKGNSSALRKIEKTPAVDEDEWFTPPIESAERAKSVSSEKLLDNPTKCGDGGDLKDGMKDDHQPAKGILWSLFSSVLRFTAPGTTSTINDLPSNDSNSLIKRCASFTGILPKKPMVNLNDDNPYKRRRTTTLSEVERYSPLADDANDSGKRVHHIYARPPINRMRQS